jgi:hypothetical protein
MTGVLVTADSSKLKTRTSRFTLAFEIVSPERNWDGPHDSSSTQPAPNKTITITHKEEAPFSRGSAFIKLTNVSLQPAILALPDNA